MACKSCFVDKDNVSTLLNESDHYRKHYAFSFADCSDVSCSWLLFEAHDTKLYLIKLINSSWLWNWQFFAQKTYWKEKGSLRQRECHPQLQSCITAEVFFFLLSELFVCRVTIRTLAWDNRSWVSISFFYVFISKELLLVSESSTTSSALQKKTILIHRVSKSNK